MRLRPFDHLCIVSDYFKKSCSKYCEKASKVGQSILGRMVTGALKENLGEALGYFGAGAAAATTLRLLQSGGVVHHSPTLAGVTAGVGIVSLGVSSGKGINMRAVSTVGIMGSLLGFVDNTKVPFSELASYYLAGICGGHGAIKLLGSEEVLLDPENLKNSYSIKIMQCLIVDAIASRYLFEPESLVGSLGQFLISQAIGSAAFNAVDLTAIIEGFFKKELLNDTLPATIDFDGLSNGLSKQTKKEILKNFQMLPEVLTKVDPNGSIHDLIIDYIDQFVLQNEFVSTIEKTSVDKSSQLLLQKAVEYLADAQQQDNLMEIQHKLIQTITKKSKTENARDKKVLDEEIERLSAKYRFEILGINNDQQVALLSLLELRSGLKKIENNPTKDALSELLAPLEKILKVTKDEETKKALQLLNNQLMALGVNTISEENLKRISNEVNNKLQGVIRRMVPSILKGTKANGLLKAERDFNDTVDFIDYLLNKFAFIKKNKNPEVEKIISKAAGEIVANFSKLEESLLGIQFSDDLQKEIVFHLLDLHLFGYSIYVGNSDIHSLQKELDTRELYLAMGKNFCSYYSTIFGTGAAQLFYKMIKPQIESAKLI